MKFLLHWVFDKVDTCIPYSIIVFFYFMTVGSGFGMFTSVYQELRMIFVKELKQGVIRQWFIQDWLKGIFWDQVVFNNSIIPDWAPGMLALVRKNLRVQKQVEILMQEFDQKDVTEKAYDAMRKNKKLVNDFFWSQVRGPNNFEHHVKSSVIVATTISKVKDKNKETKGDEDKHSISTFFSN